METILLPENALKSGLYQHIPYCVTGGLWKEKNFYVYRKGKWDKLSEEISEFTFYQSLLIIYKYQKLEVYNIKTGGKQVLKFLDFGYSSLLSIGDLLSKTSKGIFLRSYMHWDESVHMFGPLKLVALHSSAKYVVVQTKTTFHIYDKTTNIKLPGFNISNIQPEVKDKLTKFTYDKCEFHGIVDDTLVLSNSRRLEFDNTYVYTSNHETHLFLTNLKGEILLTKKINISPLTVSQHPDYLVLKCASDYIKVSNLDITLFPYRSGMTDLIF